MAAFDKEKTCCFTGHRQIAPSERESVRQHLTETIEELVRSGYTTFICGGASGFDAMAGFIVADMKERHSELCLAIAVPCRDQTAKWTEAAKREHSRLVGKADYVECIAENYFDGCMLKRNQWMVERSTVCVAYLRRERTGTSQTVRLAREQELRVILL